MVGKVVGKKICQMNPQYDCLEAAFVADNAQCLAAQCVEILEAACLAGSLSLLR